MTRRDALAQIEAAPRWSLWDFANGTKLAKVSINIAGMGLSNRTSAEWAFIHQCAYDFAGMARRRGGITVHLNAADVERYAAHLGGVEMFTSNALPDLVMQQPPASTNGHAGSPEVHHNGSPATAVRSHKRGFVLADDLFDAIHDHAEAHQMPIKDVLDQALREFFSRQTTPGLRG
jgi:hypothetical protein